MRGVMKKIVCSVLLLSVLSFAKSRDWQPGSVYKVASGNQGAAAMPVGNIMLAVPLNRLYYYIETDTLKIETFHPGGKPLNVTINKKTQVAIDGDKLFIVDDSGKEQKLKIVLKAAKVEAK
jgi:hypothetical protein